MFIDPTGQLTVRETAESASADERAPGDRVAPRAWIPVGI